MVPTRKRKARRAPEAIRGLRTAQSKGRKDSRVGASSLEDVERERNRLARAAHERFFKSGIKIDDVYGTLDP